MDIRELRTKTEQELTEALTKAKKELKEARLSFLQKKEKNIKKPLLLRRNIAKLLTLVKEKQVLSEEK